MTTIGVSPKVSVPALVLAAVGVALVVLGTVALGDETLRTLGYGALGSALATFGVGYRAAPGIVVPTVLPDDDGTGPDDS